MSEQNVTPRPTGPVERRIPAGDTRERLICGDCGFIAYENPKIVVGSVATWEGKILLCKRAIEPRRGWWTLPAGFMELGETTVEAAQREAWEEACARLEIDQLLAVYSIPRISQVQLMYRARLVSPDVRAGEESEAVGLYAWEEIPWDALAFPSVEWALRHFDETRDLAAFAPRSNPPGALGNFSADRPRD